MGSRDVSRRGVLKTGATLASVGIVGSLSGCSGLLSGDETVEDSAASASGRAADIPARANFAMSLSLDALLNDQAIRGAINDGLTTQSPDSSMMPASVTGALDVIEQESGVDPRKLNEVVVFGESQSGDKTGYGGWLTYTDWTQRRLQTLLEDASGEFSTETYSGVTVYVSERAGGDTERLAVLSDGTVALGRGEAVHDVIDVRNGDSDPISGEVLAAWEAASGEYARFALDIAPEDLPSGQAQAAEPTVENIDYAYGSVYADGDKRGVSFSMETPSEQAASEVATFVEGQIALAQERADDTQTADFLEQVNVATSGTTVSLSNEVDVDTITPVVTQVVTLFVSGMGSPGFGLDAPSATL